MFSKQCDYCHTTFTTRKRTQKFCKREHLYAWMHEFSPQKKPREQRQCVICGKGFEAFCHRPQSHCGMECAYKDSSNRSPTPEHRASISRTRIRDWALGTVYAHVETPRTKWHDHVKPDGEHIRLQGTWELAYAQYLDAQGIEYVAHRGALRYVRREDNTPRVYLPDFFLPATNEFVDVKNDYLLQLQPHKIDDVLAHNTGAQIRVVTKARLMELGLLR